MVASAPADVPLRSGVPLTKRPKSRAESQDEPTAGLSEAAPHYHGHRQRLRDRFRSAGNDALSDYELLELVLFRAIPQRDVKPLAKEMIEKFGSFGEVVAAPPKLLAEVKGLGDHRTRGRRCRSAADGKRRGQEKGRAVIVVVSD